MKDEYEQNVVLVASKVSNRFEIPNLNLWESTEVARILVSKGYIVRLSPVDVFYDSEFDREEG